MWNCKSFNAISVIKSLTSMQLICNSLLQLSECESHSPSNLHCYYNNILQTCVCLTLLPWIVSLTWTSSIWSSMANIPHKLFLLTCLPSEQALRSRGRDLGKGWYKRGNLQWGVGGVIILLVLNYYWETGFSVNWPQLLSGRLNRTQCKLTWLG